MSQNRKGGLSLIYLSVLNRNSAFNGNDGFNRNNKFKFNGNSAFKFNRNSAKVVYGFLTLLAISRICIIIIQFFYYMH